jgi:signal transduction histidine kinase
VINPVADQYAPSMSTGFEPTPTSEVSLTRRLVDRYLAFGLACVFLCVGTGVLLVFNEAYLEWAAAVAMLPLVMLLCGALVMRRTVVLSAAIEEQLCRAARTGDASGSLKRLPARQTAAQGWNAIVGKLEEQGTVAALDAKLSAAVDGVELQRWSALFNAVADGLVVCDAHLTVQQANRSAAALLNREDVSSVAGADMLDVLSEAAHPDQAACVAALRNLEHGAVREIGRGAQPADGVLRVGRIALPAGLFGEGASLWTLKDVTHQKIAEGMRTQLLFTATHELRSPLTSIRSYAELLSDTDTIDVEETKKFCNIINAEATRLSRFVDQLLNVSQMEAGGLTLARHETDLGRLVDEVVVNVQPQVAQKNLRCRVNVPPKTPKVQVDKDKLAAALVNLLGNAVKYTPDGGDVALTLEVSDEQFVFHVDDTGIGIAADELARIGDRFFRSADERVRSLTGSGLGLAFTREVARLHGGRLTVTSELNKGSRFTLVIPHR